MYYLADICFMCLKNNIKLQSVFIQDNDGIVFNEKLRSCFPEIINSTPDAHKLACSECLEKLRYLYDFKQSGIHSNTVVRNYLDKLQYQNKTRQQPLVLLPARKRRKKVSSRINFRDIKVDTVENNLKINILNLNSTNEKQLNEVDYSCQSTANENITLSKYICLTEEKNLETKIVENVPVAETVLFTFTGSTSSNEDDPDLEIAEEGTSIPNDYNNQKVDSIPLKPLYVSGDSVKFCNTCQDLLFEDLNNINVHLYTHIQSTHCSRCEDSLEDIHKFQRHMFNHCETIFEILDKGENGEKFSCALCDQQFDEISSLKKHIRDKHIRSLKCVVCSKAFTIKPNLLRHILDKHCNVKLYKCKICPTRFVCKEGIKDHMIYKHYSDKVCICKYCCQTFRNPKTLREHISKLHEVHRIEEEKLLTHSLKQEILSCAICHKEFNKVSNLKKHLYDKHVHSLKCEICPNTYPRRTGTVKHILVAHCDVKLLKCEICSIQFLTKESFKRHMNRKHNGSNTTIEPENIVFPVTLVNGEKVTCTICNKQFDCFEGLKQHIYEEHITGLDCIVCSKTCTRRTILNRHIMEMHCHLKILNCRFCPQRFACEENFKRHMNQQHSSAITDLDNKLGTVTDLDNKVCAVTDLDNKVGAVTDLDNKVCAVTDLDNKVGAVTDLDNKVGAITELDNKVDAFTDLDNKVGAVTDLDNKVGAFTELDSKVGAIIEPEEFIIKEDPYYSDEYYSSDEEYEADNYKIGKDFSNFTMTEVSNSRTSNSSNLEEAIGSSVIPTATASTEASYCEPRAPVDQSDVCDICQKMFLFLNNLSEHLNTHMQESSCSMCKDSAENINRLQRHMLTPCGNTNTPQHSANTTDTRTNDKVACVVCQQEFKLNILKKHMYTHITNLTCVVCNTTLINKISLRLHLLQHCNLKPLQCEFCDRKYMAKESLKYHIDTTHTSRVVCCQHCQKTLKCPKLLREHIIKQHPNDTYRCEVCKRIFIHKNDLEKHAKLHTFS